MSQLVKMFRQTGLVAPCPFSCLCSSWRHKSQPRRPYVLVQRRNNRSRGRQFRVKSKAHWKARILMARREMRRDGLRSLAVYALVWGLKRWLDIKSAITLVANDHPFLPTLPPAGHPQLHDRQQARCGVWSGTQSHNHPVGKSKGKNICFRVRSHGLRL